MDCVEGAEVVEIELEERLDDALGTANPPKSLPVPVPVVDDDGIGIIIPNRRYKHITQSHNQTITQSHNIVT